MKNLTDDFFKSEEFQTYFGRSSGSMIVKANVPDLTILAASETFLKITHKRREELLGKKLFDVFPWKNEDGSDRLSSYESYLKTISTKARVDNPTFIYEILNTQTGEMQTEYWSNSQEPILDQNGNVAYIINNTVNITGLILETREKELAQDNLSAHIENFKNMIRQAPVGICIVSGIPLYVDEINDMFLEIIGKSREEFTNAPYWDVIDEAKATYEPITDKVMRSGETFYANEHEILLIRNGNPEMVNVDFVYEPMRNAQGIVTAIMIVATEVTDKVASQQNLQRVYDNLFESQAQLEFIIEGSELATYDIDLISGRVSANERFLSWLGQPIDTMLTIENGFESIAPEYRELVRNAVTTASDPSSTRHIDLDFEIISGNDGSRRSVRCKGKVSFNQHNEAARVSGTLSDISEQKKNEQRKNDFIGMVSHELKTPITSLSAYIQLLDIRARSADDKQSITLLEKVVKQVNNMTVLINGFLNVSRLESGKIHIEKTRFDMADLVKESEEDTAITISTHKFIYAPVEPTYVCADKDKIGQVINNLISNAVKYSPRGSTINVACITVKDRALLTVRDEGMGIRDEDLSKLFQRYFRVENDSIKNISGFGIGLYLSAEIIRLHDGKIWAESETGKGSVFTFTIPIDHSVK